MSRSIATLVEQCEGVTLTTSNELYPDSKSAGLALIQVKTPLCEAVISPQGAQLLEFKTADGVPLLWLSPKCRFEPGKALRGGIPICLPWFGPHPTDSTKPQHGFARTSNWTLIQVDQNAEGLSKLEFEWRSAANELFAYAFTATLRMSLGRKIELELSITNDDKQTFDCSWALHSYFPTPSLEQVSVPALSGRDYLDNLENHARKTQDGPLTFSGEVDRVFPGVESSVVIEGQPSILIEHEHCPSVVTWNPGPEKAAKMADVGAGNEQHFYCIERGAVLDEGWQLAPKETRSGRITISLVRD